MAKLLIASDLHGSATAADALCAHIEDFKPDKVLFLGDLLYHGPRNDLPQGYAPKKVIPRLNALKDKIVAVRGNCEAEVDQMVLEFECMRDYAVVKADGLVFALSHGHVYNADNLPPQPGIDVFMSGHTHIKVLEKRQDGLVIVNPGSTSIPKDGSASYATYQDGVIALRALEDAHIIASLDISRQP